MRVLKHVTRASFIAAMFAATAIIPRPLHAGGGEVFCNPQGTEITEEWNVPAGGVPWTMCTGINGARIVPGFPRTTCVGGSLSSTPGGQSYARAIDAWSTASFPGGSGGQASTFAFASTPSLMNVTYCGPNCFPCDGFPQLMWMSSGCDGQNVITAWEQSCTWQFAGASAVIAMAQVALNPTTGEILEVDIALNVSLKDSNGVPFYSFVEFNEHIPAYCRSTPFSALPWQDPVFAYVDLEGVLVHELGHAAGLGHSLVEGYQVPSVGTTPTMFEIGHTISPFAVSAVEENNCSLTPVPLDAANTAMGGLIAATANTLELDDVHALATTYPTSPDPMLGRVAGTVTNGLGAPVEGVHVTAIGKFDGNDTRVGTLTAADGSYAFEGMQPGELYVFVERVDIGGLFNPDTVPNYVSPSCVSSGSCGAFYTNCGCVTITSHRTEFWDNLESGSEASPMRATSIVVSAGQTTSGIDLVIEPGSNGLRARTVTPVATPFSSRGLRLNPAPGVNPVVEFEVNTSNLDGNTAVFVYVGPERVHRSLAGELLQTATLVVGGFPVILQGTVPAGGANTITLQMTVTDAMAHHTLLAQAVARTPNGPVLFYITNPVTLFPERP